MQRWMRRHHEGLQPKCWNGERVLVAGSQAVRMLQFIILGHLQMCVRVELSLVSRRVEETVARLKEFFDWAQKLIAHALVVPLLRGTSGRSEDMQDIQREAVILLAVIDVLFRHAVTKVKSTTLPVRARALLLSGNSCIQLRVWPEAITLERELTSHRHLRPNGHMRMLVLLQLPSACVDVATRTVITTIQWRMDIRRTRQQR
mmetsp:Transcript_6467/g.10260  ORF Transcript_6467/g.10260 Transcript_6467/m.10260 type:complete len:203 (+) Transcript_6467:1263-1871(+)